MLECLLSRSNLAARMFAGAHAYRRRCHGLMAQSASQEPPAPFIVGSPRSGTTLLRMMLDSHPQVAIPPETGFIPRTLGRLLGDSEHLRRGFVDALVNFPPGAPGWQDFGIPRSRLLCELKSLQPFLLGEALRRFYRLYAARFGKVRWGDKTPFYGRHMRSIQSVLPEASFIHIIRDGRDAALSMRGLWFSPGTDMKTLARHWRQDVCAIRREAVHCRRYLEVRYESLVIDTEATLRRICDFIGLEYDGAMMSYPDRAAQRLGEHRTRVTTAGVMLATQADRLTQQRLTMSAPDASRVFRWKTDMRDSERAEYESVAGTLLTALRYRRQ